MAEHKTQVVVIGAGPGGYPAAFRAADLGLDVTLVDPETDPGGVCLYRGCIPSKTLLHAAALLDELQRAEEYGITVTGMKVDIAKLRGWKQTVVGRLTGGLGLLCKQRKVRFLQGQATFLNPKAVSVALTAGGQDTVQFEHAIIATGSRPATISSLPDSPAIMDSTGALELSDVPARLLVIGGGYIGLELGQVYAALGSKVQVVEMLPQLLPGADRDVAAVLARQVQRQMAAVRLETKVSAVKEEADGLHATLLEKSGKAISEVFDRILVSVGRRPNAENLGLESTRVKVGSQGFVETDAQRRTAEPTIFAIGDVAGQPMLAHKATAEGRLVAEVIKGSKAMFEPAAIPAVVFTSPEVAWCGLTEQEAAARGTKVKIAKFPWAASGRARSLGLSEGLTKLVLDLETEAILGAAIAGQGAGELIAEAVLAIEMGAVADDIALTIHPHPTLSETLMEAAEAAAGTSTHFVGRKL
jgi:dihydrolipoamide dehydrogenase